MAENSRILATVNGMPITEADAAAEIRKLGERGKGLMNAEGINAIVDKLIERKLILAGAKRDLIEFDKDFKAQLATVKDELLVNFALSKKISDITVTDSEVKKYYDEHQEDFVAGPSVTASHILVNDRDTALMIIDEINNGKISFEDAARKYSSCPSKDVGGALGEFTRGQMIKEFEDAAFALDIDVLSEPVQTQFGYHIIKVTGKSDLRKIDFEEIKDELHNQLVVEKQKKAYMSYVNQLKILFPVERY